MEIALMFYCKKEGRSMNRQDWLLLVVAQGDAKPLQAVQLQKSLYLIQRNLGNERLHTDTYYEFINYDYGPFCLGIYQDAEKLRDLGLIEIRREPYSSVKYYSATSAGKAKAQELLPELDQTSRSFVQRLIAWILSLNFVQLITAIYAAYPETKENSVFKGAL
jgi:hypothetical protein